MKTCLPATGSPVPAAAEEAPDAAVDASLATEPAADVASLATDPAAEVASLSADSAWLWIELAWLAAWLCTDATWLWIELAWLAADDELSSPPQADKPTAPASRPAASITPAPRILYTLPPTWTDDVGVQA
jgi:hypothetical protein